MANDCDVVLADMEHQLTPEQLTPVEKQVYDFLMFKACLRIVDYKTKTKRDKEYEYAQRSILDKIKQRREN